MSTRLLLLWVVLGIFRATERTGLTLAQIKRWPPTVPVEDGARALGVSRSAAYAAIAAGEFPVATIRVSRRLRVLTADLVRVLEGHGGQAA
jgi:Helix-turn-helix domain